MIKINKGVDNTFDLTLSEKVTITDPFFLFVFKNDVTKQETKKVIGDESAYPYRYNRFVITEGIDITFNPTGDWHYKVYEQTSSTNTDASLSTGLVEQGKVNVFGTTTTHAKRTTTRTYTAYGTGST